MVPKRQALYLTFISFWITILSQPEPERKEPVNILPIQPHWPKAYSILNSRHLKREERRRDGRVRGRKEEQERERIPSSYLSHKFPLLVWRQNFLLMKKFSKVYVAGGSTDVTQRIEHGRCSMNNLDFYWFPLMFQCIWNRFLNLFSLSIAIIIIIYHCILFMFYSVLFQKTNNLKCPSKNSCTVGKNVKWCSHYGKEYGGFLKK